jgi:hypothetical protein
MDAQFTLYFPSRASLPARYSQGVLPPPTYDIKNGFKRILGWT